MTKKELTVIIPFLNEKHEVENTLRSIREHSDESIAIVLINDASDDNFDYKSVAEKYDAEYIVNKIRLGVAASRDIGVNICNTPYFLLLDAHMRFYDNTWAKRIVNELESNPNSFLCSQTKGLSLKNGFLREEITEMPLFGAFIRLKDETRMFEPCWISTDRDPKSSTYPIPCVLGAGYACSKKYWQYLNGLEGLVQYGNDEAYISMKVWMSGGKCILLKDLIIGHIYRQNSPYSMNSTYRLYNKMFLAELFLPSKSKKRFFSESKFLYGKDAYPEVLYKLYENAEQIKRLKEYHTKIFTRGFDSFMDYNDLFVYKSRLVDDINQILKGIADRIITSIPIEIGILDGQLGSLIFLYHYAELMNESSCKEFADKRLIEIIQRVKPDSSYSFRSGLCGIGWGIEYLYQNKYIEGDTNEILEEFDKKIMEINPLRIENINFEYGLGGVVLYILSRLYTIKKEKKSSPFDKAYLSSLHERVFSIIRKRDLTSDSIDIFMNFLNYYDNDRPIEKPEIYDICSLLNTKNVCILDLNLGLRGSAGIGLQLIWDEFG